MLFGKKSAEPAPAAEPEIIEPKEAEPVKAPKANTTIIADGVEMVGDFVTSEPIELYGTIKGNVISDAGLNVHRKGSLQGDAKLSDIDIDGKVTGTIVVEGLTAISDTGKMNGKLQTARFESKPGAEFDGTFSMAEAKKEAPSPLDGGKPMEAAEQVTE